VKADLASIGVTSASALLRNLALAGESMARFAASPVTLRDGHNPIAWSSARAILRDARPELLSTLAPLREKTTESSLFVAAPDSTSKLRATRARVAEAVRLGAEGRATEALRLFDGIRRAGDFELLAEGRHNTLLTEIKQRAGFLERAGRLDEALQAYLEVPESSIRHPEALVSIARLYRRMRRNDEAKRTYERIPKEAREHHVALADLAEMAEDDEDWAAAAAGWSRLLAAAPAETGAYVRLAKAYDKLGLRVEARETARHAVALDPELSKSLQELLERIDP
jgi:tetratricopeptide (TPR) repeat protein